MRDPDRRLEKLGRSAIPNREAGCGATKSKIKGKLVEFSWYLKKKSYAECTVKQETKLLERLHRNNADLTDPESV